MLPVLYFGFTRLLVPTAKQYYSGCGFRAFAGLAKEGDSAVVDINVASGVWPNPVLPGTTWLALNFSVPSWADSSQVLKGTATLKLGRLSVDFGGGHIVDFIATGCA